MTETAAPHQQDGGGWRIVATHHVVSSLRLLYSYWEENESGSDSLCFGEKSLSWYGMQEKAQFFWGRVLDSDLAGCRNIRAGR